MSERLPQIRVAHCYSICHRIWNMTHWFNIAAMILTFRHCLYESGRVQVVIEITKMAKWHDISLCLVLPAKKVMRAMRTSCSPVCNLTMKWWEWMKTGAYLGAKTARWSSCDRSSCPLVEHSMEECLFVITPPLPNHPPCLAIITNSTSPALRSPKNWAAGVGE